MKTPSAKPPARVTPAAKTSVPAGSTDFQDSAFLLTNTRSLRALVKEAAARLKKVRTDSQAITASRGFGKGNGERFHGSRY